MLSAGQRGLRSRYSTTPPPKRQDRVVLVYRLGSGAVLMAMVEAAHGDGGQVNGAAWLLSTMLPSLDDQSGLAQLLPSTADINTRPDSGTLRRPWATVGRADDGTRGGPGSNS